LRNGLKLSTRCAEVPDRSTRLADHRASRRTYYRCAARYDEMIPAQEGMMSWRRLAERRREASSEAGVRWLLDRADMTDRRAHYHTAILTTTSQVNLT